MFFISMINESYQAGVSTKFKDTVKDCLAGNQQDKENLTPRHMEKYRKSYKQSLHYGVKDDPKPENEIIHGVRTDDSQHVQDTFQNKQSQGIKSLVNEINEGRYASHIREPLGETTRERNYQFPSAVQHPQFYFGVETKFNDTAKELLYPRYNPIHETEETKKQYLKSHQTYEPGEQKNRNYNWPVDPHDYKFGQRVVVPENETQDALHPENTNDKFPETRIVKKNQEDFKNFHDNQLEKVRNLGQTTKHLPADHVYGYKRDDNDWNAAKCLRGEETFKKVEDDSVLGKATRFGFTNQTKTGDEDRLFGAPTIRTDIIKPRMKSVADPQNYGDEPRAIELLYPEDYSHLGLDQKDFNKLRQKDEIYLSPLDYRIRLASSKPFLTEPRNWLNAIHYDYFLVENKGTQSQCKGLSDGGK